MRKEDIDLCKYCPLNPNSVEPKGDGGWLVDLFRLIIPKQTLPHTCPEPDRCKAKGQEKVAGKNK